MAGDVKVVPLEPCPFCGGEAKLWFYDDRGFRRVRIHCDGCNTQGPATSFDKSDELVAAWNRRAPTDEDPTTPEAQAAARLSLRDTFIAEKGLWSEFAETVLQQQSSLEASGGSNG